MDNVLSIKASIAALVLGVAMLSISQASSNAVYQEVAKGENGSLPAVTAPLTTKTDIVSLELDSDPGWLPVTDRDGKSGCLKNTTSQKVLCSIVNIRKIAQQKAQ
jgi:hypothetical protein